MLQRNARAERAALSRSRDSERVEKKTRWTRREEADFYRVASTFGVESNKRGSNDEFPRQYVWDTFRQLANLNKKDDDQLTDYMHAFYFMCRRVCNKLTPQEEGMISLCTQNSRTVAPCKCKCKSVDNLHTCTLQ